VHLSDNDAVFDVLFRVYQCVELTGVKTVVPVAIHNAIFTCLPVALWRHIYLSYSLPHHRDKNVAGKRPG
jgi:hypothetical protein